MTQISDTQLRQTISDILEKEAYGLEAEVIREALDYHDISDFFNDLMQHGCICGMIGSLIYYNDTHTFYDKHYSDIERMRTEYEENIGEPLSIKGDLKNFSLGMRLKKQRINSQAKLGWKYKLQPML